ncbi:MAG: hypothetical protein IMZ71_00650 [Chloroflexi bacterium]|nr:hypothetical protein [Chloroflexota bacterium]
MIDRLAQQGGKCPYTGLPIRIGNGSCHMDHILPTSRFPSSARDADNLEWVSEKANQAKQDMTKDEFILFCRQIVAFADERNVRRGA